MITEPISDTDWRARDDARTLAIAEEIKDDEARMNAAKSAAAEMLKESAKETRAIAKVAKASKGNAARQGSNPSRPAGRKTNPKAGRPNKFNVGRRIG